MAPGPIYAYAGPQVNQVPHTYASSTMPIPPATQQAYLPAAFDELGAPRPPYDANAPMLRQTGMGNGPAIPPQDYDYPTHENRDTKSEQGEMTRVTRQME